MAGGTVIKDNAILCSHGDHPTPAVDAPGTESECDQCRTFAPCVMMGEPYNWETSTANLCAKCLRAGLEMLGST